MKKLFIVLLVLLAVGTVGRYYYKKYKPEDKIQTTTVQQDQSPPKSNVKTYTLEEVAKHGADKDNYVDCWTVIHDKVYDITKFVDSGKHPGGESINEACGKDATTLFETRSIGSGTPHSAKARSMLEQYYIGDLKK